MENDTVRRYIDVQAAGSDGKALNSDDEVTDDSNSLGNFIDNRSTEEIETEDDNESLEALARTWSICAFEENQGDPGDYEIQNVEMFTEENYEEPGSFSTGIVYPAPKKKHPKNCSWSAIQNAFMRTDLGTAPVAAPKSRPLKGHHWDPNIVGWRRNYDETMEVLEAANPEDSPPHNFGTHLKNHPYVSFSITIGLKGAHLPANVDDAAEEFMKKHTEEYGLSSEYGKKSKFHHRHLQGFAATYGVRDPSTEAEFKSRLMQSIGFFPGHKPPTNVVVRMCKDDQDRRRVIGYIQKVRCRSVYAIITFRRF